MTIFHSSQGLKYSIAASSASKTASRAVDFKTVYEKRNNFHIKWKILDMQNSAFFIV